jgi:hypothetical protein
VERLAPFCGATVAVAQEVDASVFQTEGCDIVLIPEFGLLSVQVLQDPSGESVKFDSAELDRRTLLDVDLLEALGFDPAEFSAVGTSQLGVQDKDVGAGGVMPAPRYLASKTLIERRFDGLSVLGNRAVVTRDQDGNLLKINAAWPVFDETTILSVSDSTVADAAGAASLTRNEVVSSEPVLVIGTIVNSVVTTGVVCVEAVQLMDGPNGSVKPSARYYVDGRDVDPREVTP